MVLGFWVNFPCLRVGFSGIWADFRFGFCFVIGCIGLTVLAVLGLVGLGSLN